MAWRAEVFHEASTLSRIPYVADALPKHKGIKMLEFALRYAALGWFIFPLHSIRFDKQCGCGKPDCQSPGKHPKIKWKTGASCDPEVVRGYWTRWPNAGIGLATGPSGLLVADLDGPKGVEAFGGLDPDVLSAARRTARVRTARGVHVFFRGEGKTRSNPDTKLDTRGAGGYVVLPPSPHVTGHVYRWEVGPEAGIAEAPAALATYSQEGKKRGVLMGGTQGGDAAPWVTPTEAPSETWIGAGADFTTRLGGCLVDWNEVDRALSAIPPDVRMDEWIRVGMALHAAAGGADGFTRWDQWSSGGQKYRGREETSYKWTTFKQVPDGVGLGSLFVIAREHGFSRANAEGVSTKEHGYHREEVMPLGSERTIFETRPPQDQGTVGADSINRRNVFGESINGVAHALPASFAEPTIRFPDVTEGGKVKATCRNVRVAMRMLGITAEEDEFHDRMRIGGQPLGQWAGELTDNAVFMLRMIVERRYGFDPSTTMTFEAAVQECIANRFHPIKNYFNSLQWDGIPRLGTWMIRYLGAADDVFNRQVGQLSLIAAVRRVLQPGCKFDQIIVLEGVEGRGKSSAIEILASSDNFSDQLILGLRDKEQQEVIQGVWLYEIADLAGHSHAEVEKVKAFASRTVDRARPAFGRKRIDMPRRCVFFGTTNDKKYLKSQTGNRRFWPVECGAVDLEGLRRDRDQLWAEAVQAERGASLVLDPKLWGEAATRQEDRRAHDPWDDFLTGIENNVAKRRYLTMTGEEYRIGSKELMTEVLGLTSDRASDVAGKRLAFAMRRLGWDGPRNLRFDDYVVKGYTKAC